MSLKLANVIFMQEVKRCASDARLKWHTTTALHPGVVDTDHWWYVVGAEKVGKDERWLEFGVAGLGRDAALCQDARGGGRRRRDTWPPQATMS
jgi:hypothetical protein